MQEDRPGAPTVQQDEILAPFRSRNVGQPAVS